MPDQVNRLYKGKDCRIQVLCPLEQSGGKPVLIELEGADFEIFRKDHYVRKDLTGKPISWSVTGTFDLHNGYAQGFAARKTRKGMVTAVLDFDAESADLERKHGIRVIRFAKKGGR